MLLLFPVPRRQLPDGKSKRMLGQHKCISKGTQDLVSKSWEFTFCLSFSTSKIPSWIVSLRLTDSRFYRKAKRIQVQVVQIFFAFRKVWEGRFWYSLGVMHYWGLSAPHGWMSQPSLNSCPSITGWSVRLKIFKIDSFLLSLWLQDSSSESLATHISIRDQVGRELKRGS